MAQDLTNELNQFSLGPARNVAVGSGTTSFAGVDIRDYVGKITCMVTTHSEHDLGSNSVVTSVLDSADDATFAALTHATPITTTASVAFGTITVDTRQTKRYIQAKHVVTGTTQTCQWAVVGVGQKQVV